MHDVPPDDSAAPATGASSSPAGPSSVYDDGGPAARRARSSTRAIPVLGICYGMQVMGYLLGGRVEPAARREYGKAAVELRAPSKLFRGVTPDRDDRLTVWMSHGDTVLRAAPGLRRAGGHRQLSGGGHGRRRAPALRGAVPSRGRPHAAGPAHPRELPGHLRRAPHVVHGLLHRHHGREHPHPGRARPGAVRAVGRGRLVGGRRARAPRDRRSADLRVRGQRPPAPGRGRGGGPHLPRHLQDRPRARRRPASAFSTPLRGVVDPEEKRKRIGREFIAVFEEEARRLGTIPWLAQGTLYPDVIESVSAKGPRRRSRPITTWAGCPSA